MDRIRIPNEINYLKVLTYDSRIESAPLHDMLFPSKHAVDEETISVLGEIQDWEDKPIQSARAFIVPEKYIDEASPQQAAGYQAVTP